MHIKNQLTAMFTLASHMSFHLSALSLNHLVCILTALTMILITVSEISHLNLQELKTPILTSITNIKPLSFYNWIEAFNITFMIIVSGSPALWSASGVSQWLKKNSGLIYIAQNAAQHSENSFKLLFHALYIMYSSFNICLTDVMTDWNNICKLLLFIDPSFARNRLEAFTINIEVKKNITIFCCNKIKTIEYIRSQEFKGYNHEFKKAYTIAQINSSTEHYRIISYHFSDLNFVVCHETDEYVNILSMSSLKAMYHTQNSLSNILRALSLFSVNSSSDITPTEFIMTIKEKSQIVLLKLTLEIKTQILHKSFEIEKITSQLWVS